MTVETTGFADGSNVGTKESGVKDALTSTLEGLELGETGEEQVWGDDSELVGDTC